MCVSVSFTPDTLLSLSATTLATSSWLRTRTSAIRSICPVTEYTSLTPSSAAISSATSGIRETSAFTKTMAVIMSPRYRRRSSWEVRDRVVQVQVLARATDRTGPLPLDVHQTHPVGLEPAKDPFGLLGGGRRCGTWTGAHRLCAATQLAHPLAGMGTRRDHPCRHESAVPDNVDAPASVVLPSCGDDLATSGESAQPLGARGATDEGREPIPVDPCILVALVDRQAGHPLGERGHHGVGPLHQRYP